MVLSGSDFGASMCRISWDHCDVRGWAGGSNLAHEDLAHRVETVPHPYTIAGWPGNKYQASKAGKINCLQLLPIPGMGDCMRWQCNNKIGHSFVKGLATKDGVSGVSAFVKCWFLFLFFKSFCPGKRKHHKAPWGWSWQAGSINSSLYSDKQIDKQNNVKFEIALSELNYIWKNTCIQTQEKKFQPGFAALSTSVPQNRFSQLLKCTQIWGK